MDHRNQPTVVTRPANFTVPLSSTSTHLQPQQSYERASSTLIQSSRHEEAHDSDRLSQMEESLKRSVTLVFWYKANTEPIRLHQEIPTFPFFQLSAIPALSTDLNLSPTAYVDAYNHLSCAWEQQPICTVRVVTSEQRLLYRARRSLLHGLHDRECPGLADEVKLQPSPPALPPRAPLSPPLKRPASDDPVYSAPHKQSRTDDYSGHYRLVSNGSGSTHNQTYPHSLSIPRLHSPSTMLAQHQPSPASEYPQSGSPFTPAPAAFAGLATPGSTPTSSPTSPSALNPGGGAPVLRRWPNDFTVPQICGGFRQMDADLAAAPQLGQRAAFERVFGCKYVKSTVCRHKAVWRRRDLRDALERAPDQDMWTEFVKRVEGRSGSPSSPKQGQDQEQAQAQQQQTMSLPQLAQLALPLDDGMLGSVDGPVMGSLGAPPREMQGSPLGAFDERMPLADLDHHLAGAHQQHHHSHPHGEHMYAHLGGHVSGSDSSSSLAGALAHD